jgi:hypothetical protein
MESPHGPPPIIIAVLGGSDRGIADHQACVLCALATSMLLFECKLSSQVYYMCNAVARKIVQIDGVFVSAASTTASGSVLGDLGNVYAWRPSCCLFSQIVIDDVSC